MNKWTVALAATGVVSLASAVLAEESHPLNTMLPSTTLSGYVDTSAIYNLGTGNAQAARFGNTGSDRQDGFNVNAVKIAIEKPLDEGTWSAGYKAELWAGPDAAFLPGGFGSSNLALKQAYVALRAPVGNGIDFKIGQYDPIIGYEVADAVSNPNFSRSFGFQLEPLGHTGILASYQVTDAIGIAAGIANTHFGPINAKASIGNADESLKTYQAGLTLKAPDSWGWLAGSSLYAGIIDGGISGAKDSLSLYTGASISTPLKALSLGFSYDYLANGYNNGYGSYAGGAFAGSSPTSYANAFAVYASYQVTEKLKANLRGEYANSSGGIFLPGGSDDEQVTGLTATFDYSLWANVVTRAEFRWDHAAGGSALNVFDGQRNDLSLALNVIYKF
ncbi:MAG TPA: outer membrane beta-barrel protein [Candidatus Limnocylindria bacterium]|nr:outer membrane beta-barrel protein [Candidatus Limnocylindria bacterium]